MREKYAKFMHKYAKWGINGHFDGVCTCINWLTG